jgi:hypothetical protein
MQKRRTGQCGRRFGRGRFLVSDPGAVPGRSKFYQFREHTDSSIGCYRTSFATVAVPEIATAQGNAHVHTTS